MYEDTYISTLGMRGEICRMAPRVLEAPSIPPCMIVKTRMKAPGILVVSVNTLSGMSGEI